MVLRVVAPMRYFDPQPCASELPVVLPDPFANEPPPAIARRAADELREQLRRGEPLSADQFVGVHAGKMFGVLVVVDGHGQVGYLRAFSGMVAGSWEVEGFVGPLFDPRQRDQVWPTGKAELAALDRQLAALASTPQALSARAALAELDTHHAAAAAALAALHASRRQQRRQKRAEQAQAPLTDQQRRAALDELARDSRADTVAERQLRQRQRREREPLLAVLRDLELERLAIRRARAARSTELREQLYAGYHVTSARGQRRSLVDLFAPATPPGGAADCAAPKLFAHALREGLRPLALAEFWVGTPSSATGRHGGTFHPACRNKCGPVLDHMLAGLLVDMSLPEDDRK